MRSFSFSLLKSPECVSLCEHRQEALGAKSSLASGASLGLGAGGQQPGALGAASAVGMRAQPSASGQLAALLASNNTPAPSSTPPPAPSTASTGAAAAGAGGVGVGAVGVGVGVGVPMAHGLSYAASLHGVAPQFLTAQQQQPPPPSAAMPKPPALQQQLSSTNVQM